MLAAYTAQGKTRQQFATAIGVSPSTLTNATGPARAPFSPAVIHRIATELGWTYDEVVNGPTDQAIASAS